VASSKRLRKFISSWKNYLFQSLLATVTTFIVLLFLSMEHAVVIASIGATAFIVFAMPRSIAAKPRNVIGGYLVGLLCGSLSALIPQPSLLHSIVAYSLAVGLSIFIMVVADVEHPPASGAALGVAITGPHLGVILAVITSAVILALAHHFLRPFLRDLT